MSAFPQVGISSRASQRQRQKFGAWAELVRRPRKSKNPSGASNESRLDSLGVADVARVARLPGPLVIATVADADDWWVGAFVSASLFDQRAAAANDRLAHVFPGASLRAVLKRAKI